MRGVSAFDNSPDVSYNPAEVADKRRIIHHQTFSVFYLRIYVQCLRLVGMCVTVDVSETSFAAVLRAGYDFARLRCKERRYF